MQGKNRRDRRMAVWACGCLPGLATRPEEDGMGERPSDSEEPRAREELDEAIGRLRAELTRIGAEIERTASEQFEQRKPELRSSVNDLEAAIDTLATRAKGFLGELRSRLDDAGAAAAGRDGATAPERRTEEAAER
jgi:uncharacterized protein YukE